MLDPSKQEPPDTLRAGRRALDGLEGTEILQDLRWHGGSGVWTLRIRLTTPAGTEHVPAATEWYVHLAHEYPRGIVRVYPAIENGLTATFPHQEANVALSGVPWRSGHLCLALPGHQLGRAGPAPRAEPHDADNRLRWHVERAHHWLVCAATGTLLQPGERFELPQWPAVPDSAMVVYAEGPADLSTWAKCSRAGVAELAAPSPRLCAVRAWLNRGGKDERRTVWGRWLAAGQTHRRGAWIRLSTMPYLDPWQVPRTWGELRRAVRRDGTDLDALVRPLLDHLRGDDSTMLLIGFPIPEVVAGCDHEMHWCCLSLPALPRTGGIPNGFRDNESGLWQRDRTKALRDGEALRWLSTENWHPDRLGARGRLADKARTARYVLIGCGSLGSAIATSLVRGGVTTMTLIDGEDLRAGNLVRHELSLGEVGKKKASALAARLNALSPFANVVGIDRALSLVPGHVVEAIGDADVVVDATAMDAVLRALDACVFPDAKIFVSGSITAAARRLLLFASAGTSFPFGVFDAMTGEWLAKNEREIPDGLVHEGAGCWHPLFPARWDDITMAAGSAVRFIEQVVINPPSRPALKILDQGNEPSRGNGFTLVSEKGGG